MGDTARSVHVTIGTRRRRPVFLDEAVALNVYLLVREHARTLAVVLMPDHLHWLLDTDEDLPTVVERFKADATLRAEAAGHRGRLWQPGYFDAVVERRSAVERVALYLLANPVAAGLAPSWREHPWAYLDPALDASRTEAATCCGGSDRRRRRAPPRSHPGCRPSRPP